MTAQIIDGKAIASELRAKLAFEVHEYHKKNPNLKPGLTVILVGEDPASHVYVSNKEKFAKEIGMNSFVIKMDAESTENELLGRINQLNKDNGVHGILVQLPLPKQINEAAVINAIDPKKDVDGFNIKNVGLLATGQDGMVPCTPLGSVILIKSVLKDLSGKNAVVIGRSNIVGKPIAALLLKENCTVTVAHSKTQNLPELCKNADILVAAIGKPKFVKGEWVKKGAIVIDVGINRVEVDGKTKLVGDVDFDEASKVAGFITPVPGGVGPMTIACLLSNTLKAFSHLSYT